MVCGGGGIPAVRDDEGDMHGIAAVIDKDLASAMLAAQVGADAMVILTDVDYVLLDFGTPQEKPIERMTVDEARRYLHQGQFPAGSMGPKVEGALDFLAQAESDNAYVIIGPLDKAVDAVSGNVGTRITK